MSTAFTKESKPSTSYSRESKPTTGYTRESKPVTPYSHAEGSIDFLLKEDTFYLLLETGDKIVLRRGYVASNFLKESKPTTAYTKEVKP